MAPVSWNGSDMLYKRVIRPYFLEHQLAMDSVVKDLTSKAKDVTTTITKEGERPTVYMQKKKQHTRIWCVATAYSENRQTSASPPIQGYVLSLKIRNYILLNIPVCTIQHFSTVYIFSLVLTCINWTLIIASLITVSWNSADFALHPWIQS